jgi:hypothetical protein
MMKIKYFLFILAAFATMGFSLPWPFSVLSNTPDQLSASSWVSSRAEAIHTQAANLNTQVLKLGLRAYLNAHKKMGGKEILTIIDYTRPSTERRMWVIDLHSKKVLFNTWVTHGKNSGNLVPSSFSNLPGSLKSSVGVFLTERTYTGHVGYSLRLKGLETGFNDNAYRRAVVVHGAWYADPDVAKKYGQLGKSFGCPAVSDKIAKPLINTIKDNSVVFIYYPDRLWLRKSTFLA